MEYRKKDFIYEAISKLILSFSLLTVRIQMD